MPHCAKDCGTASATERKGFCPRRSEQNQLYLDREHSYYYQAHVQIFVADCDFCDFVAWSDADQQLFFEHSELNLAFFNNAIRKVELFYKQAVLLEQLGKWFSAPVPVKRV